MRYVRHFKGVLHPSIHLVLRDAVEDEWHSYILGHGEERHKVEGLKHVADTPPPQCRCLGRRHLGDIRAIDAPVYVGVAGQTAAFLDLEHSLGTHLPAALNDELNALDQRLKK